MKGAGAPNALYSVITAKPELPQDKRLAIRRKKSVNQLAFAGSED